MTLTISIKPSSDSVTAEWYDNDMVIETSQATFCVIDSIVGKNHLLAAPPNQKKMILRTLTTIQRDVN